MGASVLLLADAALGLSHSGGTRAAADPTDLARRPPVGHAAAASPPAGPTPSTTSSSTTTTAAPTGSIPALVAQLKAAIGADAGCALAVQGGRTLASVGTGTPLATASTQKLVVSAAALGVLGPDYRFVTRVVAAAPPVGGRVARLWLVGSGDPTLSTGGYRAQVARTDHYGRPAPFTPLEWLASAVRSAGVTSDPGGISGDATLLSQEAYLPTWKEEYMDEDDVGPLSALSVDEGWANFTTAYAPATNPPADAAADLSSALSHDGVAVGPVGPDGAAPAGAVTIATVTSAPLSELIPYMLATSDNHMAELLTRLVGLKVYGQGTTAAGTKAVLAEAARLGIPTAGAVMVDGSGLSTENRATCPELLAAYRLGAQPSFSGLWSGLPVAGRTGTLYMQWAGTPLAGRVVAKTGWIDNAAAIVGTVEGADPVEFAFAINGSFDYGVSEAAEGAALNDLLAYAGP